jgi:capsular exopolysaccharide synthesis family protein
MHPKDPANNPLATPRLPAPAAEHTGSRGALVPLNSLTTAAAGRPAGGTGTPTFGALMQALRRCWVLAVIVGLSAGFLTAVAVCWAFPARYPVQARVKLTARPANPIVSPRIDGDVEPSIWKANQIGIIKSPLVLNGALDRLRTKYPHLAGESVEALENAIKVDFLLGPEIMRISYNGDNPEEAAALVNAIVDAYLAELEQQETRRKDEILAQMQETLRTTVKALDSKWISLNQMGVETPQAAADKHLRALNKLDVLTGKYSETNLDLGGKETQLAVLEARLKTVHTEPVSLLVLEEVVRNHPILDGHWKSVQKNEELIAQVIEVSPAHKRTENLAEPLRMREQLKQAYLKRVEELRPEAERKIRANLEEKYRQEARDLKQQIEVYQGRVKKLEGDIKKQQEEAERLDPKGRVQNLTALKLLKDAELLEKSAAKYKEQIDGMKAEPKLTARVLRLQNAEPPAARDHSRQWRFAGLGGLGMFLVGLMGVAVWEYRSRKVSAVTEVTQGLGMNLVGTLPALPPRARQSVAVAAAPQDVHWQNRMSEAVDGIRTLLLHAAKGEGPQVVMVTSATGGEGKTSLASHLAASLARAWRKTLLIDGDLRNPAAHKVFDLPPGPGFSEVLRGEADLDVIKPTALSRLWLMPAGQWDTHAVQALAQEGVRTMFDQLKEEYDFIIVDSSPVLPVADALLLGQHVDGVVFSILRDVSRLPAVQAARERLTTLGIPTLGAVVIGAASEAATCAYQYPALTKK